MRQPGARLQHQARHLAGVGPCGHGNILEPPAQLSRESVTGVPSSAVRLTRDVVRGSITDECSRLA